MLKLKIPQFPHHLGMALLHKHGIGALPISRWKPRCLWIKFCQNYAHMLSNRTSPGLLKWLVTARVGICHRDQHTKSSGHVPDPGNKAQKKGLVYASSSADPFANLAFEDWVHDNWDLSNLNLLFLWRNEPSIVIGRHQNPWTECNMKELLMSNVKLARRRSGGGTVYHDLGNVNCTFFTHRKAYNRHTNLEMIVDGMNKEWPLLDININSRDDLVLNEFYKISGSAARLSRNIAYHHCTLLHSVNTRLLSSLLNFRIVGVKSNATESVRSPVLNLQEAEPLLSQQSVFQAIAKEFYANNPPYYNEEIYTISPVDEDVWKGVTQKKVDLMDWEWIYGKTPKFHVEKTHREISVLMHIGKGRIDGVVIQMPYDWIDSMLIQQLTANLKGVRFWIPDVAMVIHSFKGETQVEGNTWKRLKTLCQLIEHCVR